MNTETVKLELIEWIAQLDNEQTLNELKELYNANSVKNKLSEAEWAAIEEGQADIDAGRVVPHEEVMKKFEKWL